MASIHKDPRGKSPYWYCAFVLANGRRAFRSTKQTDRKKAWDVARALEKATQKARAGELTEIAVRRLLDDVLESADQRPLSTETPRSLFTSWLAGKAISTKPGVYRLYKKVSTRFLEFLADKADRSLSAITAGDIAAYRDARLSGDGVSAGTLQLDFRIIKSVFLSARRQGLLSHSPAEAVELPTNRPLERDVFSQKEIQALLTVASKEWKTAILTGYYLGARLSDAVSLRWDSIDLSRGLVHYTQGKTDRKVLAPIHQDLETQLLAIAGSDNPGSYLCPILAKTRTNGRLGLSAQFKRLMKAAGIDPQEVQSARNKFSRKSYHSLRHSFTSHLANLGVSADVRMKLVGHKTLDVHLNYSHIELEPLRAAIAALPPLESNQCAD
jgi:integrase